jgi:hypothetical protein
VEDLKTLGAKTSKKLEKEALDKEDPSSKELKAGTDDGEKELVDKTQR